jgi:hypothetical protein
MAWILPVAPAAGIVLPVQFDINSHLRNFVGEPVVAAAISFMVGTVALAVAALVVQRSLPEPGSAGSAPCPGPGARGQLPAHYRSALDSRRDSDRAKVLRGSTT